MLGAGPTIDVSVLPDPLRAVADEARAARAEAESQAAIARGVFIGLVMLLIATLVVSQLAYQGRIAGIIERHRNLEASEEVPT